MKRIILSLMLLLSASQLMAMKRPQKTVCLMTSCDMKKKSLTYSANKIWLESNPPIPEKTAVVLTIGNICKEDVRTIVVSSHDQQGIPSKLRHPGLRISNGKRMIEEVYVPDPETRKITNTPCHQKYVDEVVEPISENDSDTDYSESHYFDGRGVELLEDLYIRSLSEGEKSIAFLPLGTGCGFNPDKAASSAAKAISKYVKSEPEKYDIIKLVVPTITLFNTYKKYLKKKFDKGQPLEDK